MILGRGVLGRGALGRPSDNVAIEAIEKTELIPHDAKNAIKDFIKESFEELWNTLEELIKIQPS